MKQVLIIDASPLFREFLKEKLIAEKVNVEVAQGRRDAFIKLISTLPDLVILDVSNSFTDLMEFLEKKQNDPNAKSIPIIISGPVIEHDKISVLVQFNVIKYFTKPIKFDIFFESIGQVLKAQFSIDITPCVLELHLNSNIIFIEIAEGLNREKLSLLKYKLTEMIDANHLENPKIILMLTNLSLSFVDGANLELLFDNIVSDRRILKKNIKILSLDSFVTELIDGHPAYSGIEVASGLPKVLNSLIENSVISNVPDLISDKILTADSDTDKGSVEMRFYSDSTSINNEESVHGTVIRIAIVDDDAVIRKLLENAFASIGASCDLYDSGTEFLNSLGKFKYNLVILDIFMSGISGFEILKRMQHNPKSPPVIVYSQSTQRQIVIQALSLGAKTYMVKPQKPAAIIKKALEVLNAKI
jgi:DNA-binding response OmpR family regulator